MSEKLFGLISPQQAQESLELLIRSCNWGPIWFHLNN